MLLEKERKTGEELIGTREAHDLIIDRSVRSALVHEPGEAAVYGDLDFIVLGAVVEAVARQRLDEFCRERIFEPLEMKDTFFIPLDKSASPLGGPIKRRIAATENCPWRNRILWGEVHDPNASAMGGIAGHAGLFSTVDDVMKFGQTIIDVWHGRSEKLPRETLQAFLVRQNLPESSDWALGWDTPTAGVSSSGQYFSKSSFGHLGFTGTSLWIDLERETVVSLLTNRVHLIAKKSHFALRPLVHDLIIEAFEAG
jgi:CubicO group peptidase (beta-lactamase class C family)